MTRAVTGSSPTRARVLVHVVDINLLALILWDAFVVYITAFIRRLKEELTIVVGAAILPSWGNIVIVRAIGEISVSSIPPLGSVT
jgi:hypothetical protein